MSSIRYAKLTIPKISDNNINFILYVYRSHNHEDINTIDKVKELSPIMSIDETILTEDVHTIVDNQNAARNGLTYFGPPPNVVPSVEYSTDVNMVKRNNFTYMNALVLKPLSLSYNGVMLYYSVIGIEHGDSAMRKVTHLSPVQGVSIQCEYKNGNRQIYSCEDYTGEDTDEWEYVGVASWHDDDIIIGDYNNPGIYEQYGSPFVEKVPSIDPDKCTSNQRYILQNGFFILEIPNPWCGNNKEYNFRKLKSFKIRNVVENQYSRFSEPTYQSLLPVSIERMLILYKINPQQTGIINMTDEDSDDVNKLEVIRRDGIYFSTTEHRMLGFNKYTIPVEEKLAVFNETSLQDFIKFQIPAEVPYVYDFTIYLTDIYGNHSDPTHFTIQT